MVTLAPLAEELCLSIQPSGHQPGRKPEAQQAELPPVLVFEEEAAFTAGTSDCTTSSAARSEQRKHGRPAGRARFLPCSL
jgi:hypothetical protein